MSFVNEEIKNLQLKIIELEKKEKTRKKIFTPFNISNADFQ